MSVVAGRVPSQLDGLSDDELVQLARGGHEPAFDAIFLRYRAPLVSYCRRWLDAHRAEEVIQHTFMKAYLCLRDDARPLALRPWLYRVAHNAALNALEKKGSDWEELDENYDGVPQPPYVAEQRARFLEVVDGIGSLPTRQRDALLLNEFEGRCYADIAAQLGTSESGVRGLLRRARRQLREAAAALLLPFPAVRELARSDASRLHVDRAGEMIGSAGAIGGAGVAGGLTKVVAGVLAAGTLATGGTAIQHQRERARAAEQKAAAKPAQEVALRSVEAVAPTALLAAGDAGADLAPGPLAFPMPLLAGADVIGDGGATWHGVGSGGSVGGIEERSAEREPEAAPAEPEPMIEIPESLPVDIEPREETAAEEESPPADAEESQPPKEQAPKDQEPKGGPEEQPAAGETPREEQPSSAPAAEPEREPAAATAAPLENPEG